MLILAGQNRAFGYAAAASLALHALVLAIHMPPVREPKPEPPAPPLVAHLAEPPLPAPVARQPQQPEPAAPKRVAKPKPKPKPKQKPAPPAPPLSPLPRQDLAQEPAPAAAPLPATPAPAPPAPPVAASPPIALIAPPAAPAAPAPDPQAIFAAFRRQLLDAAVRYKRYPRVALDNGWTGDVMVRIEVDARGRVASVRVKTSSGHEVLDEQALEMFRKAAAEVRAPAALRGKAFPVEVRAIYNLQDRPG